MPKDPLPQHVWYYEVSYVRAADVYLIEMGDATVASGDRDVFQLNVHVVLGYKQS